MSVGRGNHNYIRMITQLLILLMVIQIIIPAGVLGANEVISQTSFNSPEVKYIGVQGYLIGSEGIGNITDHTPTINYTYYHQNGISQSQRNFTIIDVSLGWSIKYFNNDTEIITPGSVSSFDYPESASPLRDGGLYALNISCADSSGNWSNVSSILFEMNFIRVDLWSPYNGSIGEPLDAYLEWNLMPIVGEDPATYYWYVNKSDSTEVIHNGTTMVPIVPFTWEPGTIYYWRVCGFDGYEWANSSYYWFKTLEPGRNPVTLAQISPYYQNTSVIITVSKMDTYSGLNNISLWYKYSNDNYSWSNWTEFSLDTALPWEWNYNFPLGEGYYVFYAIAESDVSRLGTAPFYGEASCAYDITQPQVSSMTPTGVNISINSSFTINFTEPVNVSSVENAFTMIQNSTTITGDFWWSNNNKTLLFTPSDLLNYNTTYYIIINSSATDLSGKQLPSEYSWILITETLKFNNNINTFKYWNLVGIILSILIFVSVGYTYIKMNKGREGIE